ncbi:MAG: hypothetical protein JWM91_86 [Rhodospirillales bacterium]|nr:hypothetical protein [Rhodospirillales bacterium]
MKSLVTAGGERIGGLRRVSPVDLLATMSEMAAAIGICVSDGGSGAA